MQIKKSREVDLERNKPTLFFLGLAVATSLVLSAFEWQTYQEKTLLGCPELAEVPIFEVDHIPPSFREQKKTLTSEKKTKQKVISSIIDDFKFIEDEIPMDDIDFPDFQDDPLSESIPVLAEPVDEQPLFFADVMPQFPGGEIARRNYLNNKVHFTPMAIDAGIAGQVHIQFTVRIDGAVEDIVLLQGIGGGLDEIALKAVEEMPKWEPGFNKGRPVSVRFTMPITFSLR
ncbi:MAG: energy transducer TonB [Flavobacteriales bacterium]|nr:energy transducer TonB [Flavobacteriales bacterium]